MNKFAKSANSDGFAVTRVGVYFYGVATAAARILDHAGQELK